MLNKKNYLLKPSVVVEKVWNLMLSDKIDNYKATKSFGKQTPAMYKTDFPFLKKSVACKKSL